MHVYQRVFHESDGDPVRVFELGGAAILFDQSVGFQAVTSVADVMIIYAADVGIETLAAIFAPEFSIRRKVGQLKAADQAACFVTHGSTPV